MVILEFWIMSIMQLVNSTTLREYDLFNIFLCTAFKYYRSREVGSSGWSISSLCSPKFCLLAWWIIDLQLCIIFSIAFFSLRLKAQGFLVYQDVAQCRLFHEMTTIWPLRPKWRNLIRNLDQYSALLRPLTLP